MSRRIRVALVIACATVAVSMAPSLSAAPTAKLIGVHPMHPSVDHGRSGGGANCSNDGAAAGIYGLTGWAVAGPTVAHLNLATVPSGLGDVATTLQAAFNAWAGAPQVTVATDGTATRYVANRSNDLMWGSPGSSIATTYTWRWSDGHVESDVVFNKKLRWFSASEEGDGCVETVARYDVMNIAVHEFGHVFGLDHPAGARFESMYAYGYTGETLKRSPAAGDVNGIAAIYG